MSEVILLPGQAFLQLSRIGLDLDRLRVGLGLITLVPILAGNGRVSSKGVWVLDKAHKDTLGAIFEIVVIGLGSYLLVSGVLSILYRST